jgi:LAS superfamily LD-carboxypeptidase LdcB
VVEFWLEVRAAQALERARNECLRRFNDHLLITDAGRTYAQQVALKRAKPKLAATPGKSWHEAGLAIDVDMAHLNALTGSQAASEAFLAEFGFKRSCWETWHYEFHDFWPRAKGVTGAIAYIGNAHA